MGRRGGGGGGGAGGGLTSASGRWMDWMVLRSCSKRAISSLCSAAVAVSSVTWTCSSAQRPGPKEDVAVRGTQVARPALCLPTHSLCPCPGTSPRALLAWELTLPKNSLGLGRKEPGSEI